MADLEKDKEFRMGMVAAAWEHIRGSIPNLEAVPLGDRILVYPVEIDFGGVLAQVRLKKEMPELGIVLAVSWGVNEAVVKKMKELFRGEEEVAEQIRQQAAYEVGDILMLNKFSGMAVPETEAVAIHKDDVIMKLRGLPVKLKRDEGRPDLDGSDEGEKPKRARTRKSELKSKSRIITPG